PTEEEFKAVTSWVEKGGQLVIVDRDINLKFGSDVTIKTNRFFTETIKVKIEQPSDFTHDVRDIQFSNSRSFINITGGSFVYYVGEAHGAMLAELSYGKGRIIFLSEPYIMANNGIAQGDNQTLALNIIRNVATDKNVAFDEYHPGYGAQSQSGMIGYFSGTPIMWMFGQLMLLALVVVYTNGRRFARPIPLKKEDRASSLEFVGSMAHLQNLAEASDLAIENIYGRFRKRLCRYAGQPTNVSARQLAEAVGRRGKLNPAILHKVLVRCEEVMAGANLKEEELLSLATRMRQWQTELGL